MQLDSKTSWAANSRPRSVVGLFNSQQSVHLRYLVFGHGIKAVVHREGTDAWRINQIEPEAPVCSEPDHPFAVAPKGMGPFALYTERKFKSIESVGRPVLLASEGKYDVEDGTGSHPQLPEGYGAGGSHIEGVHPMSHGNFHRVIAAGNGAVCQTVTFGAQDDCQLFLAV